MLKERENVIVSATEPTGANREKIWVQKGKNLFNYETANYLLAYSNIQEMKIVASTSSDNHRSSYIKCKPNTTYTIKKKAGHSFRVSTTTNIPAIGETINNSIADHTGTTITITTGENDNYIFFTCYASISGDTGDYIDMYKTVMIEEGTTATYEPYVEPKMYVLNDNNVYEEFIKKENEIYSTNEQAIGTFLDKTLYRKVINFGALPNAATKSLLHNISNIKYIVHVKGFAKNQYDTDFRNLPFVSATDIRADIQVWSDKSYIYSKTNSDMSTFTAYVVLEYTKTD